MNTQTINTKNFSADFAGICHVREFFIAFLVNEIHIASKNYLCC